MDEGQRTLDVPRQRAESKTVYESRVFCYFSFFGFFRAESWMHSRRNNACLRSCIAPDGVRNKGSDTNEGENGNPFEPFTISTVKTQRLKLRGKASQIKVTLDDVVNDCMSGMSTSTESA